MVSPSRPRMSHPVMATLGVSPPRRSSGCEYSPQVIPPLGPARRAAHQRVVLDLAAELEERGAIDLEIEAGDRRPGRGASPRRASRWRSRASPSPSPPEPPRSPLRWAARSAWWAKRREAWPRAWCEARTQRARGRPRGAGAKSGSWSRCASRSSIGQIPRADHSMGRKGADEERRKSASEPPAQSTGLSKSRCHRAVRVRSVAKKMLSSFSSARIAPDGKLADRSWSQRDISASVVATRNGHL